MKQRTKSLIFSLLLSSGLLFSCSKENTLQLNQNCLNLKTMPDKINYVGLGIFKNPNTCVIVDQINKELEYNINPKLGFLYNWHAATDARNIANIGWHVPTKANWDTLITYAGGTAIAGGKLKTIGLTDWNTPNTGATNEYNFNGKASGYRGSSTGGSSGNNQSLWIWTSTPYNTTAYRFYMNHNSASANTNVPDELRQGNSIRLIKDNTTLIHGQTGSYIGNDGTIYPTICIGTQEWLSCNLLETKFRDLSLIPVINNSSEWISINTAGRCSFNNDNNIAYNYNKPILFSIASIKVIATNRLTGVNVLFDISENITNINITSGSFYSILEFNQFINIPTGVFIINATVDQNINNIIDPNLYSSIQVQTDYNTKDQNGNVIENENQELTETPTNLFIETPSTSNSNKILNIDTMTLNDFKEVAAKRLRTELHRVRIDIKVINFENAGNAKTLKFVDIDSDRTHAYVKNIESFFTGEDPDNEIKCLDTYKGDNTLVYNHDPADKHHKGCNFFADQLQINGICEGQIIVYTAEKLV